MSCFVGLGNRSARDKQPVIACPEVNSFYTKMNHINFPFPDACKVAIKIFHRDSTVQEKRYVCVKMYGGGMGDQIKRYCEKLEPEEYEELMDNEARVAEDLVDYDPNCIQTKDRGREVFICR